MYKDINITIDNNKKIKTNSVKIGNKYDNDIIRLVFKIPEIYISNHKYVACYHTDDDISYLVPINDNFEFVVTSAMTTHPGSWQLLYIGTQDLIVDGDINNAQTVIVSDVLVVNIDDNFLSDPIIESGIDPNIKILYDEILAQLEYFQTDEFRESIKGDKGDKGERGEDGKSAYEIWIGEGNSGNEENFLNSLKGERGNDGLNGKDGEIGPEGPTGPEGDNGYTPIKGVDYWTTEDITSIEDYCNTYIDSVIGPSLLLSQQILDGEVD